MSTQQAMRVLAAGALAALAGGVHAQSTVTLSGLIDLAAGSFQTPGADAVKRVQSGSMTTSYFGFKGTEALGDGLSAQFALEGFVRADTGASGRSSTDTFFSRDAWVGLSSTRLGSVNFGRNTTSLFVNTLRLNAFGNSFGFSPSIRHYFSNGTTPTTTGDNAWNDSVKYTSPSFGGLTFTAHLAAGEGDGGRNTGASALYQSGPLALGLAWQEVEKGAAVDDTETWQLGGSYDLVAVKVFAQYGSVDNENTNNSFDISGLGAAVPIGAGSLLAQWGRIEPDVGSSRTTFSIGYDHFLSKRTDLYAVYMNDKSSGMDAGNTYAVGLRHRF